MERARRVESNRGIALYHPPRPAFLRRGVHGFVAALAMLMLGAGPAGRGTIVGTIRWSSPVPEAMTITVSDGTTIMHRDVVVDAKSKGLRDVIVMLADVPAQSKVKDAKPAIMDQREWIFTPRVVAIQHGQAVKFENNDTVNHSVMATSIVAQNQLNSVAGPGQPIVHTFAPQKRPIMIGCSLHPWMRGWIYVADHPWFAVSDSQGSFRIDNVPPGKHTLYILHPDTNRQERRTVEIKTGETLRVMVDLSSSK